MKIIGITGGIGSGKTTVCQLFSLLGVPVYNSDDRAKKLMVANEKLRADLIKLFGQAAYDSSGELNRSYIAQIVFEDQGKLRQLNAPVHHAVGQDLNQWIKLYPLSEYVMKEAAILFESGAWRHVDAIINVWAPERTRIKRVVQRDGCTEEDVLRRMKNQISDSLRCALSDYIIDNSGRQLLIPQVLRLHSLLRAQ